MTNDIICHFGTTEVYRNKQEHRPMNTIECPEFDFKLASDGALVEPLLKHLANNNCQIDRHLCIYRGSTLVWDKAPLKQWLFKEDKQPEHLKRKNWKKNK